MSSTDEKSGLQEVVSNLHLLWLAPFLASLLVFAPNARLVASLSSDGQSIGMCLESMTVAVGLCAAVLLILSTRQAQPHSYPSDGILTISAVGYLVSYALLWYALFIAGAFTQLACTVLGAVQGLTLIPLILAWVRLYNKGVKTIMLFGALSLLLACCLTGIWMLLPSLASGVLLLVAVTASVVALFVLTKKTPAEEEPAAEQSVDGPAQKALVNQVHDLLSVVWLPFVGLLLGTFMMSSYTLVVNEVPVRSEFIGATVACIIVIILCIPRYKTPFSILLSRIVVPAIVGVSIFLGSFPDGSMPFFIGASSIYAPIMFLSLFAIASLVAVTHTHEFSPTFVLSVTLLTVCVIEFIGTQLFDAIPGDTMGPIQWVLVCGYFAIVIFNSGYTAWRQSMASEATDNNLDPETTDEAREESDRDSAYQERISQLAAAHKLTARETEILDYVGRGHGSKFIAKALFISDNTVRTHVHNIYFKMRVNSREELLELINK